LVEMYFNQTQKQFVQLREAIVTIRLTPFVAWRTVARARAQRWA